MGKLKKTKIILDSIPIYSRDDLINILIETIERKDRELKIKDEYLMLIHDIGYDYDGLDSKESLKSLIDQLIDYTTKAYCCDTKSEIYQDGKGKSLNILREEI